MKKMNSYFVRNKDIDNTRPGDSIGLDIFSKFWSPHFFLIKAIITGLINYKISMKFHKAQSTCRFSITIVIVKCSKLAMLKDANKTMNSRDIVRVEHVIHFRYKEDYVVQKIS